MSHKKTEEFRRGKNRERSNLVAMDRIAKETVAKEGKFRILQEKFSLNSVKIGNVLSDKITNFDEESFENLEKIFLEKEKDGKGGETTSSDYGSFLREEPIEFFQNELNFYPFENKLKKSEITKFAEKVLTSEKKKEKNDKNKSDLL